MKRKENLPIIPLFVCPFVIFNKQNIIKKIQYSNVNEILVFLKIGKKT